jgi:5-formyltetrahydrofolate cyclo-ligase
MAETPSTKSAVRLQLREALAAMTDADRHTKSVAACTLVTRSPEFDAARVVMLFLSMPQEIETCSIALKAWQAGKTVVVPKVSWDQRRMLPVEINSLTTGLTLTGPGLREPVSGKPVPVDMVDLVIVPGLGFTADGHRIGRGMGFYDRFLAQPEFMGIACGLAFEEQVVPALPVLDHDMPLSMLATDRGIRRFATRLIQS